MDDTWTRRDFPVLDALARLLDDPRGRAAPHDLYLQLGMSEDDYQRALYWLHDAGYITATKASGGYVVRVFSVTERGRRTVGAWPTPESLTTQLEAALRAAAESEKDPDKRTRLQTIVGAIGGIGRDVFTAVVTSVLTGKLGGSS